MVFHCSLSDCKSLQISWTLLGILADLSNAVVWMVFTCPLISKSSILFTNSLGIVPSVPTTIGITITFMFHSFFNSLARSRYLYLFSPFIFTLKSVGTAKSIIRQVPFFFWWLSLGLVFWPPLGDPFVSQNPRTFCASLGRILGCSYTTCSSGQILISCTIHSGSLSLPSHV